MDLEGESFASEDILVFREAREGTNALSDRFVSIDLNCELDDDLTREGLAREVINRIQRSRRDLGFNVVDRINVRWRAGEELASAIEAHRDHIMNETLALSLDPGDANQIEFDIDGDVLALDIAKA